ncbi:unnamed protein product [Cunninghamella echinulata]
MISVQETFTPSYFSTMDLSSSGHKMPVENFLKEALQILMQASRTVNPTNKQHDANLIKSSAENATDTHLAQKNKQKNKLTKNDTNSKTKKKKSNNNTIYTDDDNDINNAEKGTTSWLLNVTSNSPWITVETDIQTIAGLEEVLEYICTHGNHQQSSTPLNTTATNISPSSVSSDRYQMNEFIFALSETLRLSQVLMIPKIDVFRQYNSIQIMKQCVQVFIMCDGAIFMDVQQLVTMTDSLFSSPSIFHHDNPIDTLLLLSICCMMIRHVMVHRQGNATVASGLARAYYQQAEKILEDVFDIPHLSVLQSIFMLSLYPHGHIDFFSLSRYTSNNKLKDATRLALAMRLHQLDLPQYSNNDNNNNDHHYQQHKEYKRRLAWMILCADHASDVNCTGNTGLIDVNQWHVNFPQPLPGEKTTRRVEFFSNYCQIIMIRKMQLFRSAYMVVSQSSDALASAMDEKLFNTYFKSTPLSPSPSSSSSSQQLQLPQQQPLYIPLDLEKDDYLLRRQWTKEDMEPLLLEGLYCNTTIMALIPFLPRRYFDTFQNGKLLRDSGVQDVYQFMKRQESVSEVIVLPLPPSQRQHSTITADGADEEKNRNQLMKNNNNDSNNSNNKMKKKKNNEKDQHDSHDDDVIDEDEDEDEDDEEDEDDFRHLDDLEMHTVIRCLKAANKYIYVLEKLNDIDPIHCYHNTTYVALLMLYIYDMIQTNCQQYEVACVCKLNLIRLLRIIKYTQKFDSDPILIFLERMINGCTSNASSSCTEESGFLERETSILLVKLQQQIFFGSSSTTTTLESTSLDNSNLIM